ncbi:M48 family metallopeptidase [Psychrobacter sanguinis]|uniref:DUF45 domain-containing protein n=1 Tax=Psychrobacter sanguinis TaxID=861445 RepID=A0A844M0A0_9GAMM|nr:SprT family zinc-dependent metalloprotease [Psychrobacter sanguinis]MUG32381.1 DUF45 domain-containing protein [Psychrobacter sanguinis]
MTDRGTTKNSHRLYYGEKLIDYEVVRKANSRKLRIKVHPDQRVVVTAPMDTTQAFIQSSVNKKAGWIWQHVQDFAKQKSDVLPKRYISGETQFYLGRRYVLKVTADDQRPEAVKLYRGKLNVNLSLEQLETQERAAKVKSLLDNWYQQKAKAVFYERLLAMLPKTDWVKGTPAFRLLSMKKQWGSCSTQGNLVLNPHLVKAPKECIDYVILHELCHIAEYNHSEQFWRLLTQVMPQWKALKTQLDSMAELYLNE